MADHLRAMLRTAAEPPSEPDVEAARRRGAALRRRRHTRWSVAAASLLAVAAGGFVAWETGRTDPQQGRRVTTDGSPRVGTASSTTTTTALATTTTVPRRVAASISGTLADGRRWSVGHDPVHGLCVVLGDEDVGCDDEGPVISPSADPATPRTAVESGQFDLQQAGVLSYGYLPPGATDVVLLHDDGREVAAGLVIEPTVGFWAIPIVPGENPGGGVSYRTSDGRELRRVTSASA